MGGPAVTFMQALTEGSGDEATNHERGDDRGGGGCKAKQREPDLIGRRSHAIRPAGHLNAKRKSGRGSIYIMEECCRSVQQNMRVMFSPADKMNAGDSKGFAGGGRLHRRQEI